LFQTIIIVYPQSLPQLSQNSLKCTEIFAALQQFVTMSLPCSLPEMQAVTPCRGISVSESESECGGFQQMKSARA